MDIAVMNHVGTLETSKVLLISLSVNETIAGRARALDLQLGGIISSAIELNAFNGREGEVCTIPVLQRSNVYSNLKMIVIFGTGTCSTAKDVLSLQALGASMRRVLSDMGIAAVGMLFESSRQAVIVPNIAYGMLMSDFCFDKYKTRKHKAVLLSATLGVDDEDAVMSELSHKKIMVGAINLAKCFIEEPPNVLTPPAYAKWIVEEFSSVPGTKVTVLEENELERLGMNLLLGVGIASVRPPRLVTMEWCGDKQSKATPIALVGKGVTFDSGGISIKPAKGMWEMKRDMAGSAAVVGAIYAAAMLQLPINLVGVVALAENAVAGNAILPSDILVSMSGQTVEVLNTDAEGRLVLADALHYTQINFNPKVIIDIATLTGAIIVALGSEYGGLFSNSDELAAMLYESGLHTGEKLWRMPMSDNYDRMLDAEFADIKNIATGHGGGDSIMGAQFLQRFILSKDTQWAHLDIAGMDSTDNATAASAFTKGAAGFGVRLFVDFIKSYIKAHK